LAELDPYWAVASTPDSRFGNWDKAAFFKAGEVKIDSTMKLAEPFGVPKQRQTVLDFGCGLGRMVPGFKKYFEQYVGVDISSKMLDQAKTIYADSKNIDFVLNEKNDLSFLENNSIDMVYCNHVLQHNPDPVVRKNYIREFMRILRPGGLVVLHIPTKIAWWRSVQLGRRIYTFLRFIRLSKNFIYNILKLQPISMSATSDSDIREIIKVANCRVETAIPQSPTPLGLQSLTYYITKIS
jgi:ubiquinone/menaquinone biosynthesis C-methylase UbiE